MITLSKTLYFEQMQEFFFATSYAQGIHHGLIEKFMYILRLLFNGMKMVSQSPVPTCKINIRVPKMKQSMAIIIFPGLLYLYHTYVLEDVTRDLQCNSDADWPELVQILQIKGTVPCKTAFTSDTN